MEGAISLAHEVLERVSDQSTPSSLRLSVFDKCLELINHLGLKRKWQEIELIGAVLERLDVNDSRLYEILGDIRLVNGSPTEALHYFAKAAANSQRQTDIQFKLGEAYRKAGDPSRSVHHLLEASRIASSPSIFRKAYSRIKNLDHESRHSLGFAEIRIAILSDFTFIPLEPYLGTECLRARLWPEFYFPSPQQINQELLSSASRLFQFAPEVIVVAKSSEDWNHTLTMLALEGKTNDIHSFAESRCNELERWCSLLEEKTRALILVNNFLVPSFSSLGLQESKCGQGMIEAFEEMNQSISRKLKGSSRIFVVDCNRVSNYYGKQRSVDLRMKYLAAMELSEGVLPLLAQEYIRYIKALRGRSRKCIVLDCDNVLWGGIIGEDGIEHIQLGSTPSGNAFVCFQRLLLEFHKRGVVLAINSKNNLEDVQQMLDQHPDMVLRRKHFATIRANWEPKPANMLEISKELNLGLDSLLFVDDSPVEREVMRKALPEILTLEMPVDPAFYSNALYDCTDLDSLFLTAEDQKRNQSYQLQAERDSLKQQVSSLDDYLRDLKIRVSVQPADPFSLPRMVQLINKTNQFNLTTKRYCEAQIQELIRRGNTALLALKVRDKFEDFGIVGVAILEHREDCHWLDTFLLSCRVLGRGVEAAFLSTIIDRYCTPPPKKLRGIYIPTKKNFPVRDFFRSNQFQMVSEKERISVWEMDLSSAANLHPVWVEIESAGTAQ